VDINPSDEYYVGLKTFVSIKHLARDIASYPLETAVVRLVISFAAVGQ
jgi:hypothetical protein